MDGNLKPIYNYFSYYEDDVINYTESGIHPVLPEKYKKHIFRWNGHKHILKSFYTRQQAEISLSHARRNSNYIAPEKYTVFYCSKCCMYHITSEKNYNKYINNNGIQ